MFGRELNQLKLRQMALCLRNIELRAEMSAEAGRLTRPIGWFGRAGGVVGTIILVAGLRRRGRLSKLLGSTGLGLRLARLLLALRAKP